MLTRWPVVQELDAAAGPGEWFRSTAAAYLALPEVQRALDAEGSRLAIDDLRASIRAGTSGPVTVALGVAEVRPSSFDFAIRVRDADGEVVLNARIRATVVDARSGTPRSVSLAIRDALIATEHTAREFA